MIGIEHREERFRFTTTCVVVIATVSLLASLLSMTATAWAQDTGADTSTDTDTGADTDADTGTGADTDTDTDTGADTGADTDTDTDTGAAVGNARDLAVEDNSLPWSRGVDVSDRRRAVELFLDAYSDSVSGREAMALAKYKEATASWRHPAFLFNLALLQIKFDQLVEARASLEEALQYGPKPLKNARRYQGGARLLERLRMKLTTLIITCNEPDADVKLEGNTVFDCRGTYQKVLRPGGYFIEVNKEGVVPESRDVVLSAGNTRTVHFVLKRRVRERRYWRRWWVPWTVVGAGAATVLAGGYFHERSWVNHTEFDYFFAQICANGCSPGLIPDELRGRLDSATRQRWLAQTAYAVGATTLVTGVVMVFLNRRTWVLRSGEANTGAPAMTLIPTVSRETVGMNATWSF